MALKNCPECGREISDQAKSCPHCGYRNKSYTKLSMVLGIIVCLAIVTSGIVIIVNKNKNTVRNNITEMNATTETESADTLSDLLDLKAGEYVTYGTYEQDNNKSDGKEPINWLVLENDGHSLLLITEKIIDNKSFDSKDNAEWKNSQIRSYLNHDLKDSLLSSEEQSFLIEVNTAYNVKDYVCLLSLEEVKEYLIYENGYFAEPTLSVLAIDSSSYDWLLRMPSYNTGSGDNVDYIKYERIGKTQFNSYSSIGLRPIIKVSIDGNKHLESSEAETAVITEETRINNYYKLLNEYGRTPPTMQVNSEGKVKADAIMSKFFSDAETYYSNKTDDRWPLPEQNESFIFVGYYAEGNKYAYIRGKSFSTITAVEECFYVELDEETVFSAEPLGSGPIYLWGKGKLTDEWKELAIKCMYDYYPQYTPYQSGYQIWADYDYDGIYLYLTNEFNYCFYVSFDLDKPQQIPYKEPNRP